MNLDDFIEFLNEDLLGVTDSLMRRHSIECHENKIVLEFSAGSYSHQDWIFREAYINYYSKDYELSSYNELRVIQYQRSLPSWRSTTNDFKLIIQQYENLYK